MALVTCIAFRTADGKLPGDLSRNWNKIEAVIPPALMKGVILDPQDANVYVIGLEEDVAADWAHQTACVLDGLTDEHGNLLLMEAACRHMHAEHFTGHRYSHSVSNHDNSALL